MNKILQTSLVILFYCDHCFTQFTFFADVNGIYPFLFVLERDAFDALFDNAPEKLNVVKKVIVTYS